MKIFKNQTNAVKELELRKYIQLKGPFKNDVTREGREGGRVTKTVYCFHGDRGGREVWKWSLIFERSLRVTHHYLKLH